MWFKKKMVKEGKQQPSEAKAEGEAVKTEKVKAKIDGQGNGPDLSQKFQPSQESHSAEENPEAEKTKESEKKSAEPEKPTEPDWKTLYALTLADFDNYKKRAARDREDTYRFAEADILKDVLPSIDNLALALVNAKDKAEDPFVKGVQLVYDALLKAFKDHGAEPFDSLGKELDPEKMEAIATLPSPDYDEGKISTEVKRGWMLKDKLLRAAQVVVSSGKPPAPEPSASEPAK